jgi:hypothetical protein
MPTTNLEPATLIGERQRSEVLDKGYTVVPFLDPEDVQALLDLHAASHAVVPYDFYVSALDPYELRRSIYEGISAILNPKLDRLVTGYRIFLASFVTKKANSTHGKLEPHQDYTLVDQSKDVALNIWVPLCNVDIKNGCMQMVDYSQRFDHISATSKNPSVYSNLIPELEANYLTTIPMTAGEALIFDSRVLHATGENGTPNERPAVLFSVVPCDAQPLLYFWNSEVPTQLEMYEADTDFLLHLPARAYPTPEQRAGGKYLKTIEYAPTAWTVAELEKVIPRPQGAIPAATPTVEDDTPIQTTAPVSMPVPEPVAAPSLLGRIRQLLSGRSAS